MRETTRAGLLAASLGETKALWMMAAKGGVDLEVKDFEDKGLEEVCPDFKRAKVVKILQRARESRERQCALCRVMMATTFEMGSLPKYGKF